ncbi:MAG: hypothetical protein AUG44_12410 [Actinobacteria bacterium 13_1_20CM_3_71_11]|nr:MAG: hypothetical protein AUG44_12410 [Actinobacteria bacterium 13_1_20CM_3_71_11]
MDEGLAAFAHLVHVGQLLTAPQTGHHRVLTLNDSRPARYATITRVAVTSTSTATTFRCLCHTKVYRQ